MPRVLVVSPTDLTADLGNTVLWRPDVERAHAADHAAGYDAARTWSPNLVVIDGTARDSSLQLVRTLREDAATRQRAIVVVSRAAFLGDAPEFRKAGANVVLPSSPNPRLWDAQLEELLTVPPRRAARIPVSFEPWSRSADPAGVAEGRALNISVNGVLLESALPMEVGQKLDLWFRLPGGSEEFQATGEVVRRDDQPLSGIKFLVLRGDARAAIGSFVSAGVTPTAPALSGAPSTAVAQDDHWEAELRAAEALKDSILESSLDSILMLTHEGRIIDMNGAAERTLGYRRKDLVGRTLTDTLARPSKLDPQRLTLSFALATASPEVVGRRIEMTVTRADGQDIPVELTTTTTLVKGRPFYTAFLRDLAGVRRRDAVQAAARRITDASALTDSLADLCKAIHIFVAEVTSASGFSITLREPASGAVSCPFSADAPNGASAPECAELARHVLDTGEPLLLPVPPSSSTAAPTLPQDLQQWFGVPLKKHGVPFGVVAVTVKNPAPSLTDDARGTLVFLAQAIAVALERKQTELRIFHLAYHDELTGLPNRNLMQDRLGLGIAQAARDDNHLGVLLVDLDRLKVINDSLGHAIGDEVIREAAARFAPHVRKGDTLSRIGGDTFAWIIRGLRDPADAARVAQIVQDALGEPLHAAEREVFVTACVGISTFPADGTDAVTLLKNADSALHRAKEQGHDSFCLYDASMNAEAIQRLSLEHGLRRALARNELVNYYQPVIDLATGNIHTVEALLRWRHPERGLVPPAEFINLAETTGMIRSIGAWVLKAACAQARAWQEQGHAGLSVAVNLSARQLHHSNIVPEVTIALQESGLRPSHLELEITESCAMTNPEESIKKLEALESLGVRISIDDFGTGYSSMSQLTRLPLATLKVDHSFVRAITTDPDDAAIVTAIVTLGHALGLSVVAEGVETEEQLAFLAARGCDRIQGHVFSRAVPVDECTALLAAHTPERWRSRPAE